MNPVVRRITATSRAVSLVMAAVMMSAMSVSATPVTQDQVIHAQADLGRRVDEAVTAYARSIGIDPVYVSYCTIELYRIESPRSGDGSIPLGVNYYEIKNSEYLSLVINSREAYERSFKILCLANAKIALKAAIQK